MPFPSLLPCPGVLMLMVQIQTTFRVVCPEDKAWQYDELTNRSTNLFSCNYTNLSVTEKSALDSCRREKRIPWTSDEQHVTRQTTATKTMISGDQRSHSGVTLQCSTSLPKVVCKVWEYGVMACNVMGASSGTLGTISFSWVIAFSMAIRAASRLVSIGVFLDRTS